jgi:Domain of unknown function (DUF5666)
MYRLAYYCPWGDRKMRNSHRFIECTAAAEAVVSGFLYPSLERAPAADRLAEEREDDRQADLSYAGGFVVSIDDGRVVLEVAGISRVVQISNDAVVWKEFPVRPDAIELGDWLDARGLPRADGSLLATSGMVLVNVGRADGTVAEVDDGCVTLDDGGRRFSVPFSDRLEVVSAVDGRPRCEHVGALTPGMLADVVGLVLPDGTLRATRIRC